MATTLRDIRLADPVLGNLLLTGVAQGINAAAPVLFPRLPTSLRGFQLTQLGDEATRAYNTRRAPGAATKQVKISWKGVPYTVNQHSIDVPIPRELIQEQDEARRLNVGVNLEISVVATNTARSVLDISYELESAAIATDPAAYGANVKALTGGAKWSAATGTPVTDILDAAEAIRRGTGRRPNQFIVGASVLRSLRTNPEVRGFMTDTIMGPATMDHLKVILDVPNITVADMIWTDEQGQAHDIWGNTAILAYAPNIGPDGANMSLAEPAFGFTSMLPGHPFVEVPYYQRETKSWIYGATFERSPTLVRGSAGFLFQTPA